MKLNAPPPQFEILTVEKEFALLREEWEDLYRNSPLATPFQSWDWLYSWWEFYGEDYKLRLITIRDGDLLVGLMPLMLERRWSLRRLLFIGTGITDYHDVLARERWEERVSEVGSKALREMDGWHVADLQQVRPEAVAWGLLKDWAGPRTYVWQDNCPVIDVRSWEDLLKSLSKNLRSTVRRTIRQAEADGARFKLADMEDAEQAAHRFLALHRESWQGRDIAPEHSTQRFEAHLKAAARRLTARKLGGISELWRDGEVIVSSFLVFGREFVGTYLQGASQEALRQYQVSSLWIWNGVNISHSRNISCLDLERGEEPHKLRWNPKIFSTHRVILSHTLVVWFPYAGYRALYSRARQYVQSKDAPQGLKSAVGKYRRALRQAVTRRVK